VHNFRLLFNGQAPPPLYVDQPVPFGTATLRTNATLNHDAIAQYSVGHHPAGAWPFSSVLHPILFPLLPRYYLSLRRCN